MDELRKSPRITLDQELQVIDRGDDSRMGVVVNVSPGGMMVAGDRPVVTDRLYRLRLELATPVAGKTRIHLGADALWSQNAEGGQYYTGFQLIDIADDDLALLLESAAKF